MTQPKKVGIAGVGAIGSAVARALTEKSGIEGFALGGIADPAHTESFGVHHTDFDTLAKDNDLIVECLPANIVPDLTEKATAHNKDIIFISSAALLLYSDVMDNLKRSSGRAYLPSGALCGLDGVRAMREMGIESATIASTKPPKGFSGAPFIKDNDIDLNDIHEPTLLFEGNAYDASKGFPANVNVAATLSLAGIGAEKTRVQIWADPAATGNAHQITVKSAYSTLTSRIENQPDPANPKSSVLAAQSIVATLRNLSSALIIS